MAFQYERYDNDIEVDEDNLSTDSDDTNPSNAVVTHGAPLTARDRRRLYFQEKWPHRVGILHVMFGFFTLILGTLEVILLPSLYDKSLATLGLHRSNCFGVGIWVACLMVFTGSFGLRAWWYRSASMVYIFFGLVLVEVLGLFICILLVLVAYSRQWTTRSAYDVTGLFEVHIGVALCLVFDICLAVLAFTQYYEDVFFGELQACKNFVHCCLPCLCPRAISQEELLEESNQRPPSLPI